MAASRRAYPGIYMVCDPRPGRARSSVREMLAAAGQAAPRVAALEGPGFAVAAVSSPVDEPTCGPGIHCDNHGILIWAGEMIPPPSWSGRTDSLSSHAAAAIVRQKLLTGGPGILAEIDGTFCGAWYDNETRTWTVFNDRWGLIPLFWWADAERLIVSPRARLTWQASGSPLRIDEDGVADLLRTQNMLDDHTLIAGVYWLEAAHSLRYDGRRVMARRYWDFRHRPSTPRSYDEVLDGFVETSRATIDRMTRCRAPVLQGLSGGLDSRMFLAMCHDLGRVPTCYTSGFAYGEDIRFGRQLARVAGASHDALLLDERSLPEQLRASIVDTDGLHGAGHLALGAPIASWLAGQAGAVLIEGYLHGVLGGSDLPTDADVPPDRPPHEHRWARDFLHGGGEPGLIGGLLREDLAIGSLARWESHVDDSFRASHADDPLCRAEYAIIAGRSGRNDVLVPAMYRRDVLARHPACDRQMIEWFAATPASLRRARQLYIDVLVRRFPAFARVPRADGCSGMPLVRGRWARESRWRREQLYSTWARLRYQSVRRYGRDSLAARAWAFETCQNSGMFEPLLAGDARVLEYLRPNAVRRLWMTACVKPRECVPLLSLLTIEVMIRELECPRGAIGSVDGIEFQRLRVGELPQPVLVEAS
ncbi:MAG: hypothetical protein HY718_01245 [Planctomycetes bacterium]|nr:hypothetical protein [Planctomycetota bacterium]